MGRYVSSGSEVGATRASLFSDKSLPLIVPTTECSLDECDHHLTHDYLLSPSQ